MTDAACMARTAQPCFMSIAYVHSGAKYCMRSV
nr:MAG TPA: hypothetical protein [Caudoviricetes sp.]